MGNPPFLLPVLVLAGVVLLLILIRLTQEFSPSADAARAVMMATGYRLLGRHSEALEEGRHAVDLDSGNAEAHALLAHLFLEKGKIEQALPEIRESTRIDPWNDFYWRTLGLMLVISSVSRRPRTSILEEASAAFREAHRLDSGKPSNEICLCMIERTPLCSGKKGAWPSSLCQFFAGELTEVELIGILQSQQAGSVPPEAYFYVALYYVTLSRLEAARRYLCLSGPKTRTSNPSASPCCVLSRVSFRTRIAHKMIA